VYILIESRLQLWEMLQSDAIESKLRYLNHFRGKPQNTRLAPLGKGKRLKASLSVAKHFAIST
jgi:hypothetical protein